MRASNKEVLARGGLAAGRRAAHGLLPFAGLCFLFLTAPLERAFTLSEDFTALKLMGVGVFAVWLIESVTRRAPLRVPVSLKMAAVLFGGWGFASILWASDKGVAIERCISMVLLVGFAFLTVQLAHSMRRLKILLLFNLTGSMIAATLTIYNYLQAGGASSGERISAFLAGSSTRSAALDLGSLPVLLGLGISYGIVRALVARGLVRVAWSGTALVLMIAALLSGTRGFVVSGVVGIGVLILLGGRAIAVRGLAVLLVLGIVLVVAVGSILPEQSVDRFAGALTNPLEDTQVSRIQIWKVYATMIAEDPMLGKGIGNSPHAYPASLREASIRGRVGRGATGWDPEAPGFDAHNNYLAIFAELGLLGFLLFVLLCLRVYGDLLRSIQRAPRLGPAHSLGLVIITYITMVLIDGLVLTSYTKKLYWLAIGLAIAHAQISTRARESIDVSKSDHADPLTA